MRVLCLEDSLSDFALIEKILSQDMRARVVEQVQSHDELCERLEGRDWDLIISEYQTARIDAVQALGLAREKSPDVPFIVLAGSIGEEKVIELLKSGVHDVVLKNNVGRLPHAFKRVRNEFESKKREREAHRAKEEAIRSREEMLAIVSHDLRNPLAAIQLNGEAIIREMKRQVAHHGNSTESERTSQNARSIVRTSIRMKSLISDILDKVRLDAGTFQIHRRTRNVRDFLTEVHSVFAPLAQEKRIDFKIQQDNTDTSIHADFERLFQIFSNLIGNSLKFTGPGGVITLTCKIDALGFHACVQDTGSGIAPENLDKIFDKFFQNQSSGRLGVGLGLAIVSELLRAQGGSISVESHPGRGSQFHFFLPAEEIKNDLSNPGETKNHNHTIYLVEDDDDLREILVMNLSGLGYRLAAFPDGKSIRQYLENHPVQPSVAILDYRLPDTTGGEIADMIRVHFSQTRIPVVFLSAETHLDSIATTYEAADFLTKPLRFNDLKTTVEKLVRQG